ncbi:MAG: hypothetical protein GY845_25755 [Planctomycetes bacterium]|nr:hypothetical protein [Planctomycetota bacterium]
MDIEQEQQDVIDQAKRLAEKATEISNKLHSINKLDLAVEILTEGADGSYLEITAKSGYCSCVLSFNLTFNRDCNDDRFVMTELAACLKELLRSNVRKLGMLIDGTEGVGGDERPCKLPFKGVYCKYKGNEKNCNKTRANCRTLDNIENFRY